MQDVELGVRVRIRDHDTSDDVDIATVPAPVQVGDLVALDQGEPLRITHGLEPLPGAVATPVLARPLGLPPQARQARGVALRPMLARSGEVPTGNGWTYEVKWDGFRAIVSTEDRLRVRSRRGWDMTGRLPELAELPAGLVLDGEIVAFNAAGVPHFPDALEAELEPNDDATEAGP